jgi:hypothetical protein
MDEVPQEESAIGAQIAGAFDLTDRVPLVFRRVDNAQEAAFIADVYSELPEVGFRVPRPVATRDGRWVSSDGWTAWNHVEGVHAGRADVPAAINAIRAFHQAISRYPLPAYLAARSTIYDRADKAAWGEERRDVDGRLRPYLAELERVWRPIAPRPCQLIHGDLNEGNILIASSPQLLPAIIDFTPYWRPPDFALAVFAYWLGPYCEDPTVLDEFEDVPDFDQLLVRAAMRTVLITHEFIAEGGDDSNLDAEFDAPVQTIVKWMAGRC